MRTYVPSACIRALLHTAVSAYLNEGLSIQFQPGRCHLQPSWRRCGEQLDLGLLGGAFPSLQPTSDAPGASALHWADLELGRVAHHSSGISPSSATAAAEAVVVLMGMASASLDGLHRSSHLAGEGELYSIVAAHTRARPDQNIPVGW